MSGTPLPLERIGVYSIDTLETLVEQQGKQEYLIDELFTDPSFNILVGDSGLGKTPLVLSMGIAVATGRRWMNRAVASPGRVLYCNGEMTPRDLKTLVETLCRFHNVRVPGNLHFFAPQWESSAGSIFTALKGAVSEIQPRFVILDPLRVFAPGAEIEQDRFNELLTWARSSRSTVLAVHHLRKKNREFAPSLLDDPHDFLQETVGLGSLINLTDTRLAVDRPPANSNADLLLAGFVRMRGNLQPINLRRVADDSGEPLGYETLQGLEHLQRQSKDTFLRLNTEFRWKDVEAIIGQSQSRVKAFITETIQLGLVERKGSGQHTRYLKLHSI